MALVHRVAASPDLRRAARLREFLLYVCTETLERGASSIREQEIGENVFGRPSGYDTNIDNIVRVNASSLRKRLEQYFAEDGAQEEIIVEVPRGSYTPLFRRRSVLHTPVTAPVTSSSAAQPQDGNETDRPSWSKRIPATFRDVWFVAAVLLLAGCAALLWQNRTLEKQLHRWRSEPAMRAFWGNFFAEGAQTDVVIADTSFSLAQDLLQQPVSLSDYINYSYKRLAEAPTLFQRTAI